MGSDGRNTEPLGKLHKYIALLPQEAQRYLGEALFRMAPSEEAIEGIRRVRVTYAKDGPCKKCGGKKTINCDDVQANIDHTMGICFDCGYRWCLKCGQDFPCDHWDAWEEYRVQNSIPENDSVEIYNKWLEEWKEKHAGEEKAGVRR